MCFGVEGWIIEPLIKFVVGEKNKTEKVMESFQLILKKIAKNIDSTPLNYLFSQIEKRKMFFENSGGLAGAFGEDLKALTKILWSLLKNKHRFIDK